MSCLTCRFCDRYVSCGEERMRCWKEPGVCDHAFNIPITKARRYQCEYYRNIKDKRCSDCKAFDEGYCFDVNKGVIAHSMFYPKSINGGDVPCEYFQEKKGD